MNLRACCALLGLWILLTPSGKGQDEGSVVEVDCFGKPRINKVLFIGIDGTRTDALLAAETPTLDSLIGQGKLYQNVDRGPHTMSGPGWSSILTGVWPESHGVTNNKYKGANFSEYPPLFCRIREQDPCVKMVSFVHYSNINKIILEECEMDLMVEYANDKKVVHSAIDLIQRQTPDVLFVHFDDVDHAGHFFGYGPESKKYQKAIEKTDEKIQLLINAITKRQKYKRENWMVLVSTDHGGEKKGHGGMDENPDVRKVFILLSMNKKIYFSTHPPDIIDIAPTILDHLGIEIKKEWNLEGEKIEY